MAAINPYLNFDGNAEEAFTFYKSAFGGDFTMIQRFRDLPEGENMGEADGERIMHIALPIGQGTLLMASDIPRVMGQPLHAGNNFHISVNADSEEEASRLFNALSEGGKVTMPMDKMFWGALFGMLTDRFGIQWMVNYDYNQK